MKHNFDVARHIFIATAATAAGLSTICRKLALRNFHPVQFEAISSILHAILGTFFVASFTLIVRPTWNWNPISWSRQGMSWIILHSIASLCAGIAFMYALKNHNDTGYVSALMSTTPLVTLIVSLMFLDEQLTIRGALGTLLIVIGVYVTAGR
jgi:uncharacterized membrane protein